MRAFYAHCLPGKQESEWHHLEDHLRTVALRAEAFAQSFQGGDWAYWAGLWHDVGKYSQEFQDYLRTQSRLGEHSGFKRGHVDHSTAGAKMAVDRLKDNKGKVLAYGIAGHHAGLPNGLDATRSCLRERLKKAVPDYHSAVPLDISHFNRNLDLPFTLEGRSTEVAFQISFFIRMIFSCVVDADFLDTEAFFDKEKSECRKGYPSLQDLDRSMEIFLVGLRQKKSDRAINSIRDEILQYCLRASAHSPGFFSLTVPTGGGKTISSLAFALKHALRFEKERIIYVIPYTSIIEQNARIFREILGDDGVLEHHSNYEAPEEDQRSRLATENWDAPIVVTTNVQFFESLFADKPSRCRKLHNIANSVVVFDEAQMIPVPLLRPCLEGMKELVRHYGVSILLCTATQPALTHSEDFPEGLRDVCEIVPGPEKLYEKMRRTCIHKLAELSTEEVVRRLSSYERVLCIVNTRRQAREIFEGLRHSGEEEHLYHLSALMCPAHRTQVLQRVRESLRGASCRLIATQLIEAGVDLDFPIVFRALAGIDSIAQAAGRCNRERKTDQGDVFIFSLEKGSPPHVRQQVQVAEDIIRRYEDVLSLEAVEDYFKQLYWLKGELLDAEGILKKIGSDLWKQVDFPFQDVADDFRVIKDDQISLIVPWNMEAEDLIRRLRHAEYPLRIQRALQPFTISIYPQMLQSLRLAGSVECLHERYWVLLNRDLYREDVGLFWEDPSYHKVESLIV